MERNLQLLILKQHRACVIGILGGCVPGVRSAIGCVLYVLLGWVRVRFRAPLYAQAEKFIVPPSGGLG